MEDNKMVEALENFIIHKVQQMQTNGTSPEEIEALAGLVKAVNQTPRTLKMFDLEETIAVSTSATDD